MAIAPKTTVITRAPATAKPAAQTAIFQGDAENVLQAEGIGSYLERVESATPGE
jgi:hypothetical protein